MKKLTSHIKQPATKCNICGLEVKRGIMYMVEHHKQAHNLQRSTNELAGIVARRMTLIEFEKREYELNKISPNVLDARVKKWERMTDEQIAIWYDKFFKLKNKTQ